MADKDPVDDYYKPLTRDERDIAVHGTFQPYAEMLNWIRRWEATVRFLEVENLQLGERVDNAKRAIGYSLENEPDKVCDKIIWEANMAVHRILTESLGDDAANMTSIRPVGVDKSGELEFKIQIDHHEASIWLSREMWEAFATFWEK